MGKKRGGRRGKAGDSSENQQSDPKGGSETTPTTSQPKSTVVPPSQPETSEHLARSSSGPQHPLQREEPIHPGRSDHGRPSLGRERGRGTPSDENRPSFGDQTREWVNPQAERAQGRGTPLDRPGDTPQTSWGGAKPKTGRWVSPQDGQSSDQTIYRQAQGRGRGRGRGTPPPRPGDAPQTPWTGAKPKTGRTTQPQVESDTAIPKQMQTEEIQGQSKPNVGPSLSEMKSLVPFPPGVNGRPIRIETNHVRLNLGNITTAYRYDVNIEPQKKPKRMLREAMNIFQKVYYPNNMPSYDGQKLLYSAKRLPLENDIANGIVTIKTDRGNDEEFKITVKLTGSLDLSPLRDLLQKKNISSQEEAFQCVEVVFRQAYTDKFISIGRRFYAPPSGNEANLGCGAVMYLGGYQATVNGWIPLFNIDVTHKAFTTSISLVDLIKEMFSTRYKPLTDLRNYQLQHWQMEQLIGYLKGLKVCYEIPSMKKIYRVHGFGNAANQEKFEYEGRVVSVEEYFQKRWHYKLQYPTLPTVLVSKEKRICVPMECCVLKEGQPLEGSRVLASQTSEMIEHSASATNRPIKNRENKTIESRKKKIQDVMQTAGHNSSPYIREFGFSIGGNFENLEARVLDPPMLVYSDGRVEPERGAWRGKKFKVAAEIRKWGLIGFGVQQARTETSAKQLARMISDVGNARGMVFGKPREPFEFIRNDKQSLIRCLNKMKDFDLIVVIIPNNKDSYYMVKQVAEQHVGLLTQCVKVDTLSDRKLNESTVGNILLKLNCKMNGTSHVLHQLGLLTDEPCMVMGADVTHPSPQAKTIPSVVAITASHDLTATNYSISVSLQKPRTEIIKTLQTTILEKLKIFIQKTGKVPKRIYYLRDGVSDGEFNKVKETEARAILEACRTFKKDYQPKLTVIIVQKRHHTRFFPTDSKSSAGDKYNNVPVGTCVDTVIVDPNIQSHFLMSHQSIRGVGRPTKYCVLHDDNKLTNDDVQLLTYYLCHVYPRCNRAVSYPAPTYLAHLAADRAKGYLHNKSIDLENLKQELVQINKDFVARNPMFFA